MGINMRVLKDLEPAKVFEYFEDICNIPHGSGKTKKISDYLVKFALEHKLRCIQDDYGNVVIFKKATPGYECSAPIIIQGHMDMVCEKADGVDIDFDKEGLRLIIDGDVVRAEGTTLGADDGIAVAYALAILDSETIEHPPLEVLITVDEEIGMLGASFFDARVLHGKTMLNLDTEDEGYLLVSCAGGATVNCTVSAKQKNTYGYSINISISGLTGGHSGIEIHKGRASANQIMGRLLYKAISEYDVYISDIAGGLKDNAIPRSAICNLIIGEDQDVYAFSETLQNYANIILSEISITDPNASIDIECSPLADIYLAYDIQDTKRIVTALYTLPGGVQKMSQNIPGLVQTSLNMGILKNLGDKVVMSFSARSSVASEKDELISRIRCVMDSVSGSVVLEGEYPAWEYKKDSKLRDMMIEIYKEQYGSLPIVYAVHAGVECGIFADKIPGLDCVSFGPELKDIHTPQETMNIESVRRVWNYILEILKRLK